MIWLRLIRLGKRIVKQFNRPRGGESLTPVGGDHGACVLLRDARRIQFYRVALAEAVRTRVVEGTTLITAQGAGRGSGATAFWSRRTFVSQARPTLRRFGQVTSYSSNPRQARPDRHRRHTVPRA